MPARNRVICRRIVSSCVVRELDADLVRRPRAVRLRRLPVGQVFTPSRHQHALHGQQAGRVCAQHLDAVERRARDSTTSSRAPSGCTSTVASGERSTAQVRSAGEEHRSVVSSTERRDEGLVAVGEPGRQRHRRQGRVVAEAGRPPPGSAVTYSVVALVAKARVTSREAAIEPHDRDVVLVDHEPPPHPMQTPGVHVELAHEAAAVPQRVVLAFARGARDLAGVFVPRELVVVSVGQLDPRGARSVFGLEDRPIFGGVEALGSAGASGGRRGPCLRARPRPPCDPPRPG